MDKPGFPYVDGRIKLKDDGHFDDLTSPSQPRRFHLWGALDDRDGELRLRIRQVGVTHETTAEIEITFDDQLRVIGIIRFDN